MSTIDRSRWGSTIVQQVFQLFKPRKLRISTMAMYCMFKCELTPLLLFEGPQEHENSKSSQLQLKEHSMAQGRDYINTYLPMEFLREIFLYCIEVNQMKSGQLASVCRHWRSVITSIASLWSTLRVGTWTETEQVSTWVQRAYPKKVVIDTERDRKNRSEAPAFAALRNALTSTDQWREFTISSFPPEDVASQLGIQVANAMNVLKVLQITAGCVHSPSISHLLDLVPAEGPLCELRLYPTFASAHFLQPHWFPVLQNLTALIVNGTGIDEPFELLPSFTQLQIFEADHLRLLFYEPHTNIPLLCTLRKLQLRACSVQWMVGREFLCLEECAILLPRHWETIQRHEVQLPSCKKLIYHGYPMTTAQYFHVPKMRAMGLRSHDFKEQRVYHHLRHLCRVDGRISKLTTLHLTFQCSEQVLVKVLKYLVPLQELVLSIAHPSPRWQKFLQSLAAKSSTNESPTWNRCEFNHQECNQWFCSQTWRADILPHLKYLGIHRPKRFSQSERLDNLPLLRLAGWTRAHLIPPLEHLKVWEGRESVDDIAVDYISAGYLDKHPGISSKDYDVLILLGMVIRRLVIYDFATPLFQLHSTVLFRGLQHLKIACNHDHEIPILPCLEQIESLEIWRGIIPVYPLNLDLPLAHTLQWLNLHRSASSWMLGRTFKALGQFQIDWSPFPHENLFMHEGLQVDLPACTILELKDCPMDYLRFLSCPNVRILRWWQPSAWTTFDLAALNSPRDFLFNLSCLQELDIIVPHALGLDSMIHLVFCGAWQQAVWRDIRSVELEIQFHSSSEASHFFDQTVGHQRRYEKWWQTFTVTKGSIGCAHVNINASV